MFSDAGAWFSGDGSCAWSVSCTGPLGSSSFAQDVEVHLLIPWDGHAQGKNGFRSKCGLTVHCYPAY